MRSKLSTIILTILLLVGVSLLLYPTASDYWNSLHASQAVENYVEQVQNLNSEQYDKMLRDAQAYNQALLWSGSEYELTPEQQTQYQSLLNLDGSGIMGYIEIPMIKVSLPIYHGAEDSVLQMAVGHLEWSSLPVGGESTHCVISGHRGLPSAKLFTNLDKLSEGDTFNIRVLDEVLTYEIDQILIVEPNDLSALSIEEGKDLCTLVTCTPYGINSHRLLIRGHRIQSDSGTVRVTSDAMQIEPVLVAPLAAIPILLLLLIGVFVSGHRRKKRNHYEEETP